MYMSLTFFRKFGNSAVEIPAKYKNDQNLAKNIHISFCPPILNVIACLDSLHKKDKNIPFHTVHIMCGEDQ